MTTYAERLAAWAKTLLTVWDFPDLSTRILTRKTADLATPGGWTVFEGALARRDSGSELDVFSGELSIAQASFDVPDARGAVTAWLVANDISISQAKVIRREGFAGTPESEWAASYWILEDYSATGDSGGGYRFILRNTLALLSSSLFEDFDQEAYRLNAAFLSSDTQIELETSPKGIWREPGLAFLWNDALKAGELVAYETIGGTGDRFLLTLTRDHLGVGAGISTDLQVEDTEVYHVWARRGDPIEVALRLILTDPEATGPEEVSQLLSDPGIDTWPLSAWSTEEPGGSSVIEETQIVRNGSSARLAGDGTNRAVLKQQVDDLDPGMYFRFAWYTWDAGGGAGDVQVKKITGTPQWWDGSAWQATEQSIAMSAPSSTAWTRQELGFQVDAGFASTDDYEIRFRSPLSGELIVESAQARGPYTSEPATLWDDGTGDGLGISTDYLDLERFELIRDQILPPPTFDGSGNKTSGVAILLVESAPIDDLKEFLEASIFRAFALWPVTDGQERLSAERYVSTPPVETTIGDEWLKGDFRASAWNRDLLSKINQVSLASDHNPAQDKFRRIRTAESPTSIERYQKSKLRKVESRGGRNGLDGFPDYGSQEDLTSTAGLIFLESASPNGSFPLRAFWKYRDLALGSVVRINAPLPDLVAGTGTMQSGQLIVLRRQVDPEKGNVELKLRQRRSMIRAAFVAPDSVASTYAAASEADRVHCYIAPDESGFPSDGTAPYTVV